MNRREAIKLAAASAATLLLSGPAFSRPPKGIGKRVVIVGAGLSGLACGSELHTAGYRVVILEARKRLGGRVVTFANLVPGKHVEGGGEYIGSNHAAWVAYKERFGLDFLDFSADEGESDYQFILDGKHYSGSEARTLFESMERASQRLTEVARDVNADQPWLSPDAELLDRQTMDGWLKSLDVDRATRSLLRVNLISENGVAPEAQSFLGMLTLVKGGGLEKYWSDSFAYRCKGGNSQLAHRLAADLGPERIVLDLPVMAIEANRDRMSVVAADGRVFECDDVVLAVPPSVWHRIAINADFVPMLAPQMGTAIKYLAALKHRPLDHANTTPVVLGDETITSAWDGTHLQGGEGSCIASLSLGPAVSLVRHMDETSLESAYRAELRQLFPRLDEHHADSLLVDWRRDRWTQAGFSFPAPGQVTTVGPLLYKGYDHLHFAGEHACYKFCGFMEGALQAGITLAKRLAQRDGVVSGGSAR